jgi:hypothetical protein
MERRSSKMPLKVRFGRTAYWLGLVTVLSTNALLITYLIVRLHAAHSLVGPIHFVYLVAVVLPLSGAGLVLLVPFVVPSIRRRLGPVGLLVCALLSTGWVLLGGTLSLLLGL